MAQLTQAIKDEIRTAVEVAVGNALDSKKVQTDHRTTFQKTESILYVYPNLEKVIANKKLEILEVQKSGVPAKDKSIVEWSEHGGTVQGIVLPEDGVDSIVGSIGGQIAEIERCKLMIDHALEHIKDEPYYPIIECKYFCGMTVAQIMAKLGISDKTVTSNKNKLVRSLATWLFPAEVVKELLE